MLVGQLDIKINTKDTLTKGVFLCKILIDTEI